MGVALVGIICGSRHLKEELVWTIDKQVQVTSNIITNNNQQPATDNQTNHYYVLVSQQE